MVKWAKSKRKNYRKKTTYRRSSLYGTKASFMPTRLAQQRYNSVSTKTFYFKGAGSLASGSDGVLSFGWRCQQFSDDGTFKVPAVPGDFVRISQGYCEYKILAIKIILFSANQGAELLTVNPPVSELLRGNHCIYKDQDINDTELAEDDIERVINYGSANLIPSRISKWACTMYRPKGKVEWGNCNTNIDASNRVIDEWNGGIFLLGNDTSPIQKLWFFQSVYKVVFRGRNYEG